MTAAGLPSEGVVLALLGFNAGVELGQAAVVGLAGDAAVVTL
jgi:hypothetical protein